MKFISKLIITVLLSAGASFAATSRQITLSTPTIPVESPFRVTATGTSDSTIKYTQVYIDNVKVYQVNGGNVDQSFTAATGKHRITVQIADANGTITKTTYFVEVLAPVQSQPHSVDLTWNPVTDTTILGYNIYRSLVPGGSYSLITPSPIATTAFTDDQVTSGMTYYYVATAVASTGSESGYSNEASAVIP